MTPKELRVRTYPRTHPPNYPTMSSQVLSARATGTRNESSLKGATNERTNAIRTQSQEQDWPATRKSSDKNVCSAFKRAEEEGDVSLQEQ